MQVLRLYFSYRLVCIVLKSWTPHSRCNTVSSMLVVIQQSIIIISVMSIDPHLLICKNIIYVYENQRIVSCWFNFGELLILTLLPHHIEAFVNPQQHLCIQLSSSDVWAHTFLFADDRSWWAYNHSGKLVQKRKTAVSNFGLMPPLHRSRLHRRMNWRFNSKHHET